MKELLWLRARRALALLERDRSLSRKFDFDCSCSSRNSFEAVNPLILPHALNSTRIKAQEEVILLGVGKGAGVLNLGRCQLAEEGPGNGL